MAIQLTSIPLPAVTRLSTKASKYNFGDLMTGSEEVVLETEVVDVEKTINKMTSALVAYRKRTKDFRKFTVRATKNEDGTEAVGVWCIGPAPAPKVAAVAAPVAETEAA